MHFIFNNKVGISNIYNSSFHICHHIEEELQSWKTKSNGCLKSKAEKNTTTEAKTKKIMVNSIINPKRIYYIQNI